MIKSYEVSKNSPFPSLYANIKSRNKGHNIHGTLKTILHNFLVTFLNNDFSFDICSIHAKFLETVLYCLPEANVSQHFESGPRYFLWYVEI